MSTADSDDAAVDGYWAREASALLRALASSPDGLASGEAVARLRKSGPNALHPAAHATALRLFLRQFTNPLVLILVFAALVSVTARDWADAAIIAVILVASATLSFFQEHSANRAMTRLRDRLALRVDVCRDGTARVVPAQDIVRGDVVVLKAGSLIPADGVLLEARDLFVSESVLTGESFPAEKRPGVSAVDAPLAARANCVHLGTSVRSGTGRALIVRTGQDTAFGAIADSLTLRPEETEFERGVRRYSALLSRIMIVLVVSVFTVSILSEKPAIDALLFAVALAVGISPELLPAIIAITLSRGAREMARHGVIVRRLNTIENFGSMDVLCTDKTGTLTEGVIRLDRFVDASGEPSDRVLRLAVLNARLQTGMANPLDAALIATSAGGDDDAVKLDEIPYDFVRKRLSVVVRGAHGMPVLICKGAVAQVLQVCSSHRVHDGIEPLDADALTDIDTRFRAWSEQGFRVLAVATREATSTPSSDQGQEVELTLEGFLLFFDPPRQDARATLAAMAQLGVRLKILTGDNRHVTRHIAGAVGLSGAAMLTGAELSRMHDEALWQQVDHTDLFVELDPMQKSRIIRALRQRDHVVGYLGDGINDAPALHDADVGISVDGAADVAREAADLVLIEHDLDVLRQGIVSGRTTFANSIKYVLITTSANFGNMISMAALSLVLPFLPLLATQVLLNNFLSDIPAIALAGDKVDRDWIERPHRWDIPLLTRFMLVFGLVSTVFDFLTFAVLLGGFDATAPLFRTGWFVESLLTELAVVLLIRTRGPFHRSSPSRALLWSTAGVATTAMLLPWSPAAGALGLVPLPAPVLVAVLVIVMLYAGGTEWVKRRFHRSQGLPTTA